MAAAGITKGRNPPVNNRFCPDGKVTRGQMAAFLRRTFRYPAASKDYFTDDDISIFEADINTIAKVGVTKGCNPPANDRYCPSVLVRRDQMASFLARALGLMPITPPAIAVITTIADRAGIARGYTSRIITAMNGSARTPAPSRRPMVDATRPGGRPSTPFAERRRRVAELHAAGMTLAQIAAELGIGQSAAHRDLHTTTAEPSREVAGE